uniref:Peptidase S1 domain-containing protein n=1 Tax=Acrobeloides nanus TaxID=290746 RepID=A0A914EAT0_9BILA
MRSTITISLILLFCPFVTGFICGIRGNGTVNGYFEKPSNDIYGGCYTIPGEYPWQALLWLTYNDGHQFICGATLISDEFLLTSASCVTNATQIQVKLGIVDQMKGTPYNVFKVTIHPEYNSSYFLNNIAVIQARL